MSSQHRTSQTPWIISRGSDLLWFHGSVLPGLCLLLFFRAVPRLDESGYSATAPAALALLFWGVFFDGTHVFGTYARSYLAKDATSKAGLPGIWSFLLLLVGPAVALFDHTVTFASGAFRWFLIFAYLYAYFHLVRQHYGFLSLYRRRINCDGFTRRLEDGLLWIGCLHPYLRYSLTPAFRRSGLPLLTPVEWAPTLITALDLTFAFVCVGALVIFVYRRIQLAPRHLLLLIVVAFHELVFFSLDHLLAITATLTIFHNLQYHRIVWQYERGMGRVPLGNPILYLALGMILGLLWYGARITGVALAPSELVKNLLLGFGWGVAFHHYFVDARIWRVRRSPALGRAIDVTHGLTQGNMQTHSGAA